MIYNPKKERLTWTDRDLADLGWHDCSLYSIYFPDSDLRMRFDIDYIFKWERVERQVTGFWVSPAIMIFSDVLNLKIEFDSGLMNPLTIGEISVGQATRREGATIPYRVYLVQTDFGSLSFEASGFKLQGLHPPVLVDAQALDFWPKQYAKIPAAARRSRTRRPG